ncbi:cytochrome P450 [Ceratobasidium sp. AG-I]|nr:cytochrome P450 [Ceratobasidium sp. AG-I]
MNSLAPTIFIGVSVVWFIDKWVKYNKTIAQVGNMPRRGMMFSLLSPLGVLLPQIPYISGGGTYPWSSKRSVFEQSGSEVFILFSLFPTAGIICVSDAEAIKQISSGRSNFGKNTSDYGVLRKFGNNILVVEGDEWKRQRRICAPAFSDRNNRLVWTTTTELVDNMLESWVPGKTIYVHDACEELTLPISLCVIAKAGFGQSVHWTDEAPPPADHKLTFKQCLVTFSENIALPLVLPSWAWGLRKHWRHVKQANDELRIYIQDMVRSRREPQYHATHTPSEQKYDLLSQLVDARDADEMLSEDELVGNILIFLLAGHDTTAHALAMLLGLLALYPQEQLKLVYQIQSLQETQAELTYEDMRKLTYAIAVLYETLRLYPAAPLIPKFATENTTLSVGPPGHAHVYEIPASTHALILASGLHYNPNYWDDPNEFMPSRFTDTDWNRDAFIPFSLGPRACIGRRFAETTIVAVLVRLLSRYRVSVDEARFKSIPGESMAARRDRFMNPTYKMTLAPSALPLVFTPIE